MHAHSFQLIAQFCQGQIGLLPQPVPQPLLDLFRDPAPWAVMQLHRPLLLARVQLLHANLLAVPPTHTELRRQLPQAACARFIGFQKLAPQIIRIG
jgi:hypothetical protein